jgi:T5SS/PEP-CTERM-associated repeat protein
MNRSRFVAILAALLLWGAGQARADGWNGFFSSDWFFVGNWDDFGGPPGATEEGILTNTPARTDIQLSSSTTIRRLVVSSPFNAQYTVTGSNGAVLTATDEAEFRNADFQTLNVHTLASLGLSTLRVEIIDNAVLALDNSTVATNLIAIGSNGRVDINDGSSVQTLLYGSDNAAGEFRINSGGELRVGADATLHRGTTTVNSGGQLNALSGVDLEYTGSALLQFFSGHAVDDGVHLKATGGADITSTSFIDVGNSNASSLTVTGSSTTFTAGGSTSDWGFSSSGNATVMISDSAVATVAQLRAGTGDAQFVGTVSGGATLHANSTFTMGGGATIRQVSLDVNGGTLDVDGSATFNNFADLNLVAGTVNFDGGATFNSGSRIDWSGGSVNLGTNTTLLVDGGTVNKVSTAGLIFSGNTTTRIKNGGSFTTPSFFDLGNATLDMDNGTLTTGTAGGSPSDWGANSATTTATLSNNAVATYNSGLRMSFIDGGTTNATIASGARVVASFLSAGGTATSSVTLNVNGGRVESAGAISVLRGASALLFNSGRMEAQDVVLGSAGGTAGLTLLNPGATLHASGTLFAGREGTSTLTIFGGADARASTRTVIGERGGANGTVVVANSGSTLVAGSSLTVGDLGVGTLLVSDSGFVSVIGGATVNALSKIELTSSGALEIGVGNSIANEGEIKLSGGSQIRGDISNAGRLRLFDSSVTRGVTLLADSQMFVDNSSVGSLTQQADAEILFELHGASNFDNLSATGAATLGGDLVVSLAGGFSPILGAEFAVLIANSVSGVFANEDFSAASLASGLTWDVLYSPTSVTLKVVNASLPGDFDDDDDVDGADFLKWQRGESPNPLAPSDFADWKANFGATPPPTASVPEPSAGLMGILGAAFIARALIVANRQRRPAERRVNPIRFISEVAQPRGDHLGETPLAACHGNLRLTAGA